jgi:hypothetical protein
MYNMDISIFGYKLNIQVIILICVLYLILVGHTICGCSHRSLKESFTGESENMGQDSSGNVPRPTGSVLSTKTKGTLQSKEGFTGSNINYGESTPFDLNSNVAINTSSWSAPDMTIVPGKPLSPGVKKFLAREQQPVPLPEGELFMFATTPFKPECCPNTYSNSQGCACMTGKQYNYILGRGGNNVPYSEY